MTIRIIGIKNKEWEDSQLSPNSVYVESHPKVFYDSEREILSVNHHEGHARFYTHSACGQILHALKSGFNPEGKTVYINDLDADTVVSCCLLSEPSLVNNQKTIHFVNNVGLSDNFGPAYPISGNVSNLIDYFNKHVLWLIRKSKINGDYDKIRDLRHLCKSVIRHALVFLRNIDKIVVNEKKVIVHNFDVIERLGDMAVIFSHSCALKSVYDSGINSGLIYRENANGTYKYTIFKKSDFTPGDLRKAQLLLNALEGGWGGASTIIGSPRHGSGLDPEIVWEKVKEALNA